MTANTQPAPSTPNTGLQGRWLTIMRVAWYVCALLVAIVLIGALPGYYSHYAQAIGTDPYGLGQFNLPFQVLVGLGDLASGFISFALAVLLFWRKPNDRMALFASCFFLITAVAWSYALDYFLTAYFGAPSTYELWSALLTPLGILLVCIFPDGRFVPRWTRWIFLVSIPASFSIFADGEWLTITRVVVLPLVALLMYAQVYRYRHVSNYAEHKQTKWVVFGFVVSLVLSLLASIIYKKPSPPLLNILPLSLTIAILRSHLWDIDLIIRKTVQYTVISGLLLAVYLLAVGATSFFFSTQRDYVIPLIALIIVAYFLRPWYRQVVRWMDRVMPMPSRPPEESSK